MAAREPGRPFPLQAMRVTGRAVSSVRRRGVKVTRVISSAGFPYRKASVPGGVEKPAERSRLGAGYDTDWAREPVARAARAALVEGVLRPSLKAIASPEVRGVDRLEDLRRLTAGADGERLDPPALIFTPNHHSHLDTPLCITAIPGPWRHRLVVGAAADYFFTTRVTSAASALVLNAFPIDRHSVGRQSADLAADLIGDGWSLVIYPEGGRSPDGWGQAFKGGAAYLSIRTGAPVVPMFIDGTGSILGKGMKRPKPGRTTVVFGTPLRPDEGESTRRFNERIERAVTQLGDETLHDWWTARQRAAAGTSPSLSGPEYRGWRRQWALAEQRSLGQAGRRRRQKRRWPDLGR
jgi:1-acyl-sn-glycerol-3-phosphate acyltransferase